MMRLLRVAEGQPPIIFRFTESPGDTPRAILERAQSAVRKALRGDAEAGSSSNSNGIAGARAGEVGASSGAKAAGKGKGGKDGCVLCGLRRGNAVLINRGEGGCSVLCCV